MIKKHVARNYEQNFFYFFLFLFRRFEARKGENVNVKSSPDIGLLRKV